MPERRRSRRVWRRRTPKRGQGKPPPPAPPPPVVRLHERVVSPSEELPSSGLSSVPSQEGSEPVAVEDIAAHPVTARKEIERLRAELGSARGVLVRADSLASWMVHRFQGDLPEGMPEDFDDLSQDSRRIASRIAARPVAPCEEIERLRADARELWEALLTRITSPGEIGPLNTLNKHRARYGEEAGKR